jgi:hypothetical protein
MSSKLAEHLQKLGYPGGEELGYQTFLYGTEKELRNVFLFLLDKMPKDKEPTRETLTGKKLFSISSDHFFFLTAHALVTILSCTLCVFSR